MKHTRNRGPLNLQYERKSSSGGSGNEAGEAVLEIKKLVESIGRGFEEYKSTNDAMIKAKADGKIVSDFEAKLAKIEGDLGNWTEAKAQLDEILVKFNRPGQGGSDRAEFEKELKSFNDARRSARVQGADKGDASAEEYEAYKGAFWEYQRKGNIDWLKDAERKAMSVGTDADGGYLVPAPTQGRIVQRVWDLSPIRQIANVQSISGDALEGVNDLDEAAYGWVGEVGTRSDTNSPQVGKYRIEAFEMYAQPKATQKLLDDAAVDIERWLADKVANKFARAEGAAFVTGTGAGQPRGFATYTTAATGDSTRSWGQIEHVVTGANGAFHTTQADPLHDLIGAFKPHYLQNAKWVTRREVIAAIRKFKTSTTSEYIWQPGLQAGQPDRLLGYPIVTAQDLVAHTTTGALSMWLGDWMEAYQIVDRLGMRTLRDPYTDKPYVKFYTIKRVGGAVTNFEALKAIKFSA